VLSLWHMISGKWRGRYGTVEQALCGWLVWAAALGCRRRIVTSLAELLPQPRSRMTHVLSDNGGELRNQARQAGAPPTLREGVEDVDRVYVERCRAVEM